MIDGLIGLLSMIPFESRIVQLLMRLLRRLRAVANDPFVDLYGCPCSDRTERLQLKKRKYM